jgi:hypothetical protein
MYMVRDQIVGNRLLEVRSNKPKRYLGAGVRQMGTLLLVVTSATVCLGQTKQPPAGPAGAPARVRTEATFRVSSRELHNPMTIIAYGDMRFTDPSNTTATNPGVRQALVARIAEEDPDAVLLNGDVPWRGLAGDYSIYKTETQPWRNAHLRIYPALGNHEFADCEPEQCLANWWQTFPELRGRRWYSVQLGSEVYAIALDSDTSLLAHSQQSRWLEMQLASLPASVKFVLIAMHHPPVADVQTRMFADHNPRENEIALANLLGANRKKAVKFVVIAGHIHNYERFEQHGVIYLVSGGGGAVPYPVDRAPDDAYQDASFPNYHYLKFVLTGDTLKATMFRLADPNTVSWEIKDTFEVQGMKTKE